MHHVHHTAFQQSPCGSIRKTLPIYICILLAGRNLTVFPAHFTQFFHFTLVTGSIIGNPFAKQPPHKNKKGYNQYRYKIHLNFSFG